MSSIRWSPEAADDLERIYRRIETDNPAVALGVVQTIYDAATTRCRRFRSAGVSAAAAARARSSFHRHCPTSSFTE